MPNVSDGAPWKEGRYGGRRARVPTAAAIRRLGLVVHPTRRVERVLEEVGAWASAHGVTVGQIAVPGQTRQVADPVEAAACDLLLALGGDGTALVALHAGAPSSRAVLGVACGSVGVLMSVAGERVPWALEQIATGRWTPVAVPGLDINWDGGQGVVAINDLVVIRDGPGQVVVSVNVDGVLYARVAGDGLVVATPLGSSAYTMASGGPSLRRRGGNDGHAAGGPWGRLPSSRRRDREPRDSDGRARPRRRSPRDRRSPGGDRGPPADARWHLTTRSSWGSRGRAAPHRRAPRPRARQPGSSCGPPAPRGRRALGTPSPSGPDPMAALRPPRQRRCPPRASPLPARPDDNGVAQSGSAVDQRAGGATGLRGRRDREVRRFSAWARAARRAPRACPAPRAAARRRAGPRACAGTAAGPCEAGRRPPGPASIRCEGCCTRRLLSLRGPVRLGLAALLEHDAMSPAEGGRATQGGGQPHL